MLQRLYLNEVLRRKNGIGAHTLRNQYGTEKLEAGQIIYMTLFAVQKTPLVPSKLFIQVHNKFSTLVYFLFHLFPVRKFGHLQSTGWDSKCPVFLMGKHGTGHMFAVSSRVFPLENP